MVPPMIESFLEDQGHYFRIGGHLAPGGLLDSRTPD
jgi:hypothetical protein